MLQLSRRNDVASGDGMGHPRARSGRPQAPGKEKGRDAAFFSKRQTKRYAFLAAGFVTAGLAGATAAGLAIARSRASRKLVVVNMYSRPRSWLASTRYLPAMIRVGVALTPVRTANCLARLSLAVTAKLFIVARNLLRSTPMVP